MKKVAVVIPIYKKELDVYEKASLTQLRRVLHNYDLYFLAPESLSFSYGGLEAGSSVLRFPDHYFVSNLSYSKLMLETSVYEALADYEYMLLYQLDAFVFADRLMEFCELGYDYIGAPLERYIGGGKAIGCYVGNGGLSLRRIASTLRILRQKEQIFAQRSAEWVKKWFLPCEDVFFSFCATVPELKFRVPPLRKALDFAVGTDVCHVYRRMPTWLPFGCHGWNWLDYWFWKPVIEAYGYALPEPKGRAAISWRRCRTEQYLVGRLLRPTERYLAMAIAQRCFAIDKKIAIWGWGRRGHEMYNLLTSIGVTVAAIIDRKADKTLQLDGVQVMRPDFARLRGTQLLVVVTTTKFEDAVCRELAQQGFLEGQDYMRMTEVLHRLAVAYAHLLHNPVEDDK